MGWEGNKDRGKEAGKDNWAQTVAPLDSSLDPLCTDPLRKSQVSNAD